MRCNEIHGSPSVPEVTKNEVNESSMFVLLNVRLSARQRNGLAVHAAACLVRIAN